MATGRLVQGVWPSGVVIAPLLGYPYAGSQKERELSYFISLFFHLSLSPPLSLLCFPLPKKEAMAPSMAKLSLTHTGRRLGWM